MIDSAQIISNLRAVREQIAQAAARAGRDASDITLVAVSKTFPVDAIRAAVDGGATVLGESRIQEGVDKIEQLGPIASWHLIGHLQSNKAGKAIRHFDLIHSIDSVELAGKVSQAALREDKKIPCLVEVNSSAETSKFGFAPDDILLAAAEIAGMPGIDLRGLMTIGPWTTNEGCICKAFEMTRGIFERLQSEIGDSVSILSMGMSSDFPLAIECGSTMVRVGSAIFGTR